MDKKEAREYMDKLSFSDNERLLRAALAVEATLHEKEMDKVESLETKLAEAVEALEFYGNKDNWLDSTDAEHMFEVIAPSDKDNHYYENGSYKTNSQGGKRARSALEKIKAKKWKGK